MYASLRVGCIRLLVVQTAPRSISHPIDSSLQNLAAVVRRAMLQVLSLSDPNFAAKFRHELETTGFLYLSDHGMTPLVNRLLKLSEEFFALPTEQKEELSVDKGRFRGYSSLGSEVTLGKADWHECLDFMAPADGLPKGATLAGENKYPGGEFRQIMDQYFEAMNAIGKLLLTALNVNFDAGCPFSLCRVLNYPPLPNDENESKDVGIGCGAHTDYGFLTFVRSETPGLEVQDNEKWIPVETDNDYFVVNIGDSLSALTGLRATPHRVVHSENRLSCAFFYEPPYHHNVTPLNPEIPSYIYGEYLSRKYAQSYPKENP